MLMAGLDGIQNKIEPPKPVDKDIYELEGREAKRVAQPPALCRGRSTRSSTTRTSCSAATSSPGT